MNALSEYKINNIYGAPVYHFDICESTMIEARALAAEGAANGTVAQAEYQSAGRGRMETRRWNVNSGDGLLFTIILRYVSFSDIPSAVTLRAGLAAALALEDLYPPLAPLIAVKWPNDIMLDGKKLCGILTESDGSAVYIGIGINVHQNEFPPELNAASIAQYTAGTSYKPERRVLLETVLRRLHNVLKNDTDAWRAGIEKRLYMKGKEIQFVPGAAENADGQNTPQKRVVRGILAGIDADGALLLNAPSLRPACGGGAAADGSAAANIIQRFVSGELVK